MSDDLLVHNVGVSAAYQRPPHVDGGDVGWSALPLPAPSRTHARTLTPVCRDRSFAASLTVAGSVKAEAKAKEMVVDENSTLRTQTMSNVIGTVPLATPLALSREALEALASSGKLGTVARVL